MAIFAVGLARRGGEWSGQELDLDDVEDLDELAERLRDVDEDADTVLGLIEQDDEYCAIVRVNGVEDARVFVSDEGARSLSRVAALLLTEIDPAVLQDADDEEDGPAEESDEEEETDSGHGADGPVPYGEADLVADLGTSAGELVRLCENEGVLPADVLSRVCERAGCLDELEVLRER